MKKDNDTTIQTSRSHNTSRGLHTDILINPRVVEQNNIRLSQMPPRRKRRTNYIKKILNDPFIMNV